MPPLGKQWRSLLEDPERAAIEFPALAEQIANPLTRRRALKVLAASLALAGCDPAAPDGVIVPAVVQPPEIVPGLPNRYTTASLARGDALGIVVTHQSGRPLKVEGNPHHPASLGATDAFAQALILDFYDPDRAAGIQTGGQPASETALVAALSTIRAGSAADHGAGLRVLTGAVVSPTLGFMLDQLLERLPAARWHQWEAVNRDAPRAGALAAFGQPVEAVPRLAEADVILALDSDLLDAAPGHVRLARDFASRRNPTRARMSRLYTAEATPTLTGAAADHRFIADPATLRAVLLAVAAGVLGGDAPAAPDWVAAMIVDLTANRGRALVHAGPSLSAEAHALVHAINAALAAPLDLLPPPDHRPEPLGDSLRTLIGDMQAGRVGTLVVLDSNPAFTHPDFADAMARVPTSIVLSPAPTETSALATWSVPGTHLFESWGDARAFDGTVSVLQPQALPLFGGRDPIGLLSLLTDDAPLAALDAVRGTWAALDDRAWADALADGVIPDTARATLSLTVRAVPRDLSVAASGLTLALRPDPHLWDGRHANNPWLQELPRPLTKLVWDNPLLISPALAARQKLVNGSEVTLRAGGGEATLPVWIAPGQAENVVTGLLGFGRRVVGAVGAGAGWDLFPLVGATGAVELVATGRQVPLASTDHHDVMAVGPQDIVRHATLAAFTHDPLVLHGEQHEPAIYRRRPEGAVQWGMSIDLNSCIGCNACVVACAAENNVPMVGKEAVLQEREMHWLRIDRYFEGTPEAPESYFQPMLCMHCESAPCEPVCPFGATVHDQEGLNVMVYNRCAGTRFCSNNCPYKVRRFNWAPYTQDEHRPAISRNPDVTVRARGVMEKCTFCVQRIAEQRIAADRDGVPEQVATACQSVCPTRAFTFGNINDPHDDVVARKASPLDYAVLAEQGTHPRVTYEGRIRNRNPALET